MATTKKSVAKDRNTETSTTEKVSAVDTLQDGESLQDDDKLKTK